LESIAALEKIEGALSKADDVLEEALYAEDLDDE
jgi:hypothetical protein